MGGSLVNVVAVRERLGPAEDGHEACAVVVRPSVLGENPHYGCLSRVVHVVG